MLDGEQEHSTAAFDSLGLLQGEAGVPAEGRGPGTWAGRGEAAFPFPAEHVQVRRRFKPFAKRNTLLARFLAQAH